MSELPKLTGARPVTDAEVDELRTKGHVLVRGIFSPEEIAAYRPSLREHVLGLQQARDRHADSGGNPYNTDAWTLADAPKAVADFVTAPRLGALAARLLKVDVVRILYFQPFFKPAFGPPASLHQDTDFVPLDTGKAIMIWIPLVDVTPKMGGLVFAEGSHLHGNLNPAESARRFRVVKSAALRVGDVSIHNCWTIHGSLKNSTGHEREAVGTCLYADGARIATAGRPRFHEVLMTRIFPGLGPGDIAAGPFTPVVFRRDAAQAHN